ncbi:muropeptide MFS transporter [Croceicoccus naphthovorans]|uniref:Beta-lactamase n=1 Tax=Croceicoccus naphthovorans TaxID=1348774 RepID=A0A0G3XGA5_9SPHN|nr:muropeptide MFS transporter [Croceicoccus naphthovorans]AKM09666.1 beta-lactamase [Croceicoccus naphthovorans]MBB3990788.1 PAT family beta-lactamase induction signal transducer AmpG [Croceicoccus naphthovorans]
MTTINEAESNPDAEPAKDTKPGFRKLLSSLGNRKTAYMLLFGFASGLPYTLLLSTLYAWMSDAEVDLETMGVFSLIGLAFAFKFLWSPLLDRIDIPGIKRLGHRKQWIVTAQFSLAVILVIVSRLDPGSAIGMMSLLAGIGAFASATQDVVMDAWRVDVADEVATIDILSTVYQLGWRSAVLVGGALALFMAERLGWPTVYAILGATMGLVALAAIFAPEPDQTVASIAADDESLRVLRDAGQLSPKVRGWALAIVGVLWAWALVTVGVFMVRSLSSDPDARPDSVEFIQNMGPVIVIATVVVPVIIAAVLENWRRKGRYVLAAAAPKKGSLDGFVDQGYRALILPLAEFVGRLGWAVIIVLTLVLSYRFTDTVWGSFAYPFYLGELNYTKDEVAVASKFFGVGALMAGIALGGALFSFIGRMAVLFLGALTAALSNLLYADLALGGYTMQAVSNFTGFTMLVEWLGGDARLAKLMVAIAGENLAGGLAGAALVAYLSSITAKGYSAVQYALLSSLTFLIGTLGRGALGQMIDEQGYYPVFILTTLLGFVAVVACIVEWIRVRRLGKGAGMVAPV